MKFLFPAIFFLVLLPTFLNAQWTKMDVDPSAVEEDSALVMAKFCGRRCQNGRLVVLEQYCSIPDCFPCDCSKYCSKKGTCCPTVHVNSSGGERGSYTTIDLEEMDDYFDGIHSRLKCEQTVAPDTGRLLSVATCPESWKQYGSHPIDIIEECENPTGDSFESFTPYIEEYSGLTFANIFCARCNGFVPSVPDWYGVGDESNLGWGGESGSTTDGGNNIGQTIGPVDPRPDTQNNGTNTDNQPQSSTMSPSLDHTQPRTGGGSPLPGSGSGGNETGSPNFPTTPGINSGFGTEPVNNGEGTTNARNEFGATSQPITTSSNIHTSATSDTKSTTHDFKSGMTTESRVGKGGTTTPNVEPGESPQTTTESPINHTDPETGTTDTSNNGTNTDTQEGASPTRLYTTSERSPTPTSTPNPNQGHPITTSPSPGTDVNWNQNGGNESDHSSGTGTRRKRDASNHNGEDMLENTTSTTGNLEKLTGSNGITSSPSKTTPGSNIGSGEFETKTDASTGNNFEDTTIPRIGGGFPLGGSSGVGDGTETSSVFPMTKSQNSHMSSSPGIESITTPDYNSKITTDSLVGRKDTTHAGNEYITKSSSSLMNTTTDMESATTQGFNLGVSVTTDPLVEREGTTNSGGEFGDTPVPNKPAPSSNSNTGSGKFEATTTATGKSSSPARVFRWPKLRNRIVHATRFHDVTVQRIPLKIGCENYQKLYHIQDALEFFNQAKKLGRCIFEFELLPSDSEHVESPSKCSTSFVVPASSSSAPKCHNKAKKQYKNVCSDLPQVPGLKVSKYKNIFCYMCSKKNPSILTNGNCKPLAFAPKPQPPNLFDLTHNDATIKLVKDKCATDKCYDNGRQCAPGKMLFPGLSPLCLSAISGIHGLGYTISTTLVSVTSDIENFSMAQSVVAINESLLVREKDYSIKFFRHRDENRREWIEIDITGSFAAPFLKSRDAFEIEMVRMFTTKVWDILVLDNINDARENTRYIQFKPACLGTDICEIYRTKTRTSESSQIMGSWSSEGRRDPQSDYLDLTPSLYCPHYSYFLSDDEIEVVNNTLNFTVSHNNRPLSFLLDQRVSIIQSKLKICEEKSLHVKWEGFSRPGFNLDFFTKFITSGEMRTGGNSRKTGNDLSGVYISTPNQHDGKDTTTTTTGVGFQPSKTTTDSYGGGISNNPVGRGDMDTTTTTNHFDFSRGDGDKEDTTTTIDRVGTNKPAPMPGFNINNTHFGETAGPNVPMPIGPTPDGDDDGKIPSKSTDKGNGTNLHTSRGNNMGHTGDKNNALMPSIVKPETGNSTNETGNITINSPSPYAARNNDLNKCNNFQISYFLGAISLALTCVMPFALP